MPPGKFGPLPPVRAGDNILDAVTVEVTGVGTFTPELIDQLNLSKVWW
ncbi:MAG: hypothetical protein M2R45_02192 [Verrucomicrobia subdivision 3 bacterium]|nr:hypothetical protein [Limisphaerales bacterium]MCS1413768.1 hypothetical protein [Limisphaerales bacterium]